MANCPHCGSQISDEAQFCPVCGKAVKEADPNQAPYPAVAPVAPTISSTTVLKNALGVIFQKPIKLWGISLLALFLSTLATILGGPIPIIGIAIGLVIEFGMAWVYLEGYRGREVKIDQIFEGFYNFWHTLAGMGWKQIVLILWFIVPLGIGCVIAFALGNAALGSIIPNLISSALNGNMYDIEDAFSYQLMGFGWIAVLSVFLIVVGLIVGTVFYCIKYYAYSLVPYITREDPNMKALDIARASDARTNGFKGKMFLTDLLAWLLVCAVYLVFGIFSVIPGVGGIFAFIGNIVEFAISLFLPLLFGLIRAAWYEEICKFNAPM